MGLGILARNRAITPLAALASGLVAGAVGTACLDATRYAMYRREGGAQAPLDWEFPPVESWDKAPDPGQVARRLIEGFTQRELPDRWAWLTSTVAHWAYGTMWGALYGIAAGSLRSPRAAYGLPLGAAVWISGYALLPQGGIYKPIGEYDAATLAKDLTAHLAYGAGTGTVFWLLAG